MDESPASLSTRDSATTAEERKSVDAFDLSDSAPPVSLILLEGGPSENIENAPAVSLTKKREIKLQNKRDEKIERVIQSAKLFIERINDEDKENVDPMRHFNGSLSMAKFGKKASSKKSKKVRERPVLATIGRTVLGPRF